MSKKYLYLSSDLQAYSFISSAELEGLQERHKFLLKNTAPTIQLHNKKDLMAQVGQGCGVVFAMEYGLVGNKAIRLVRALLKKNIAIWFYWLNEGTVEHADRYLLATYYRLWVFVKFKSLIDAIYNRFRFTIKKNKIVKKINIVDTFSKQLEWLSYRANPIQFIIPERNTFSEYLKRSTGVYVRMNYWANKNFGGAYAHACYLANGLRKCCEGLLVLGSREYALMNEMGIKQEMLGELADCSEDSMILANEFYYSRLRSRLQVLNPAFIYERLSLGNFVGARLSLELNIPYIVEYNGSEIIIKNSFDKVRFKYEDFYLAAEMFSFAQATAISVVSDVVADQLIERGVPPHKLCVNPNGACPDRYCPPTPSQKQQLRAELNISQDAIVVGFVGSFTPWHGIEVLSEIVPRACAQSSSIYFLLVGDGASFYMIQQMISQYHLTSRVICLGEVAQEQAADWLKVCDIYLSPHVSNLRNSPFFGSPMKIFEYLAMGGAIVASDLMQISAILSPAIAAKDLHRAPVVGRERAVLCQPKNVAEFVDSLLVLAHNHTLREALGKNARAALVDHYSWEKHVGRLWNFLDNPLFISRPVDVLAGEPVNEQKIERDDYYKKAIGKQWDNDPCGSHYVKTVEHRTLEWFLQIEDHRHREYAPWMLEVVRFEAYSGQQVLEIGGGLGTDLAQFAISGAKVIDLDLSLEHLKLARLNFYLRGLEGKFIYGDAEDLPLKNSSVDLVYTHGCLHHTPNTQVAIDEIWRVLKPGGWTKAMFYAEHSWQYWKDVEAYWYRNGKYQSYTFHERLSEIMEISATQANPLVKTYTKSKLSSMFAKFENIKIQKRQLMLEEVPRLLRWLGRERLGKLMGWNLIVSATKPNEV